MKTYLLLILFMVNCNVIAEPVYEEDKDAGTELSQSVEPRIGESASDDGEQGDGSDATIFREEIVKLQTKIESMENDILNLSAQIRNVEQALKKETLQKEQLERTKISATNTNKPKSSVQKNYDEEKKDYDLALTALKDGDYKVAEQRFAKFIDDHPDSSLLSNTYFWYGESYYRQKDFEKAGIYFLNGYKKFPRGIKASDSLLKLALSLSNLEKGKDACRVLDKLQKEFKERSLSSIQKEKEILEKFNCPK